MFKAEIHPFQYNIKSPKLTNLVTELIKVQIKIKLN